MPNPLINPQKIMNNVINSKFPQVGQALNNPVKLLMAELEKGNMQVLGRVYTLYQNPQQALNMIFKDNPQALQMINSEMSGKSIKEQQQILLKVLKDEGIDVQGIAQKIGIRI